FAMSLDNVIAIAGAAQNAHVGHQMFYVIFGLLVSVPIIVWGSTLVLRLMDRFPLMVTLGAGLLGWIAGGMLVSDVYVVERLGSPTPVAKLAAELTAPWWSLCWAGGSRRGVGRARSNRAVPPCGRPLGRAHGRTTPAFAPRSNQDDVVLFLRVRGFHFQRHRFADEISQHRQMLAFFFQEQVHHALRGQDTELARVELARLAQYFAQNLIADRAGRAHRAARLAHGAGLAQLVCQ